MNGHAPRHEGSMPNLVSVRPTQAPSTIPTDHLTNQAEKWVPGSAQSPSPYPPSAPSRQPQPSWEPMQLPTSSMSAATMQHSHSYQPQPFPYDQQQYHPGPQRHSFNGPLPSTAMLPQPPPPNAFAPASAPIAPPHLLQQQQAYGPQSYAQPQYYQPAQTQSAFLAPSAEQQQQPYHPPRAASMVELTTSFDQFSINPSPNQATGGILGTRKGRSYYAANPQEGPPYKLAVTFPDQNMLAGMRETAMTTGGGAGDMQRKIAWSKQVLKFIERHQAAAGETSRINDPVLVKWTDEALNHVLSNASSSNPVPLALYLRGDLSSTGSFPSYRSKDLKSAFRDFEAAANAGYEKAWFRIGRSYEDYGDIRRAVGAYEIGVSKGDCGSTYRMAMAYLLGQIGVTPDYRKAIQLLYRAADTADLDTPQPPYILGMLLSGDLDAPSVQIPKGLVPMDLDEARCRIERSAYLSFGPAQYKMGYAYEYATLGCLHDPLLSVQYYALASQNGEVEADMALSKWYLCGSEGHFEKNERLAYTFAEKAASRNLASAEFALGYYYEVGIHVPIDVEQAKRWYSRASSHGNSEAADRIKALSQSDSNALSRREHEAQIDQRLVRKRTQAAMQSDKRREQLEANRLAASLASTNGAPVAMPPPRGSSSSSSSAASFSTQQHQQYYQQQSSFPQQPLVDPSMATAASAAANGTTGRRRRDTLRQVEAAANMQYTRPTPTSHLGSSASASASSTSLSMSTGRAPATFDARRPSGGASTQVPYVNSPASQLSSSTPASTSSRPSSYQLVDQPSAHAMQNKVQRPVSQQQQPAYPSSPSSRPPNAQQQSLRGSSHSGRVPQPQQQHDIPVRKKPETFSEMGIVTTKAKKDECIIM